MNDLQKISGAEAASETDNGESSNDTAGDYTIDVETAAELLGVGTTRLSQLTTRGVLSFQRRKIGFRNRLFYNKSEIETYLEQYFISNKQSLNHAQKSLLNHKRTFEGNLNQDASPSLEPSVTSSQLDFSPILEAIRETSAKLKTATSRNIAQPKINKKSSALELRKQLENESRLKTMHLQLEQFQQSFTKLELKIDSLQRTLHAMSVIAEKRKLPAATSVTQSSTQNRPQQTSANTPGQHKKSAWPSFSSADSISKPRKIRHNSSRAHSRD